MHFDIFFNKIKMTEYIIYSLLLNNNKYYIGKTKKDVQKRFKEHLNSPTNKWVKKYKPIKINEYFKSNNLFAEDNLTKSYMSKYGIDNVRGGSYTTFDLQLYQKNMLLKEFNTFNNLCFECNKPGHFSSECSTIKTNINNTIKRKRIRKRIRKKNMQTINLYDFIDKKLNNSIDNSIDTDISSIDNSTDTDVSSMDNSTDTNTDVSTNTDFDNDINYINTNDISTQTCIKLNYGIDKFTQTYNSSIKKKNIYNLILINYKLYLSIFMVLIIIYNYK